MKVRSLKIKNFKAIKNIELNDLGDTVLIAGPNGCGKSCIFHSIRLLKSIIGGYQDNEWHMWFNEFQIKPQNMQQQITKLFQTETRDLKIEATFELSKVEKDFLIKEGKSMLEFRLWKRSVPSLANRHYRDRPLGAEYRELAKQISDLTKQPFEDLKNELKSEIFEAKFEADRMGNLKTSAATALQLAFSVYGEDDLGVVDYHGPHRDYQREELANINLNIQTSKQNMQQHSLYNYSNKYKNVKQEMAGHYLRKLLMEKAGETSLDLEGNDLIDTLKELFEEFFPGKVFLGPTPNKEGGIDFPVRLPNGKEHDINDLSSGEKEVLYGYLRLRYSARKNSIIMLDEPELHLNPRLIMGLPRFYKKNLGEKLSNQLWLVTHSDEFLRQSVGEKDFQVYHLQASGNLSYQENQIKMINADDNLEMAIIDLVGDLATYAPHKKIVFVEGENSDFDMKMISRLFPDFHDEVNLISVGSKSKVIKLHELLDKASSKGELKTQFFSIVDKDADDTLPANVSTSFTWNVYHIENYLLEEDYIAKVVNQFSEVDNEYSADQIKNLLIKCAKETVGNLVAHKMRSKVWNETFSSVELGFSPHANDLSQEVFDALKRNVTKLTDYSKDSYLEQLKTTEKQERMDYENSLTDSSWKEKLRGRDILKRLVVELKNIITYEALRNAIISQMVQTGFKPEGMEKIISSIKNS